MRWGPIRRGPHLYWSIMTTYTRTQVEHVLLDRCSQLLTFVGKDGSTSDGTNSDLNYAIGTAVRKLGGSVAQPTFVTNADVQSVDADYFDALLDIAELRLYYSIRGNLTVVDTTAGPFTDKYSDIGDYLDAQIKALENRIEMEHGIGGPEMLAGVITRDIASHDEDPV